MICTLRPKEYLNRMWAKNVIVNEMACRICCLEFYHMMLEYNIFEMFDTAVIVYLMEERKKLNGDTSNQILVYLYIQLHLGSVLFRKK